MNVNHIEIETSTGVRTINFKHMPALDGWDIQHRFLEFAASSDADLRRAYIMEVLGYCTVDIAGSDPMQLKTAAIINNHVETWKNIELVFEGILQFNGIDPKTHADRPQFWSNAGAEMATSFLASVTELFGPALKMIVDEKQD